MTIQSVDPIDHIEVDTPSHPQTTGDNPLAVNEQFQRPLPDWVQEHVEAWGENLKVAEWVDDGGTYRKKSGWQGRDLVHDRHAPVRLVEYYVKYGTSSPLDGLERGGVGTTLTGVAHFTPAAESHQGFCHGGSMCSVLDDVVGWTGFMVTGKCLPWSGFTVQVNTTLKNPIPVDSMLVAQAVITKVERRKVTIAATIFDPEEDEEGNQTVFATCEGLVIVNRGVMPSEASATTTPPSKKARS